jgi:hypothetical protein
MKQTIDHNDLTDDEEEEEEEKKLWFMQNK